MKIFKVFNTVLIMSVFLLSSTPILAESNNGKDNKNSGFSEQIGSSSNNDPGNAKNIDGSKTSPQSSGSNSGSQGTGQESGGGSSSGTQGSGSSGGGAGQ